MKFLGSRSIATSAALQSKDAGVWNKRWQPEFEKPKTDREKAEVAKKYGLIPEDYKPYENGLQGDYPNLDEVPRFLRDGHHDWDDQYHRRNYGEPVPENFETLNEDRTATNGDLVKVYKRTLGQMLTTYVYIFTFLGLCYWFLPPLPLHFSKVTRLQWPSNNECYNKQGVKHLGFRSVAEH